MRVKKSSVHLHFVDISLEQQNEKSMSCNFTDALVMQYFIMLKH